MDDNKEPMYKNGKICYIELPSTDVAASANFYKTVFGWYIRLRGDGKTSFDDAVGQVSGVWVNGPKPYDGTSLLIYIMVDDAELTIKSIIANGGHIVQQIGMDAPQITAKFSDPTGNIFGIYQQPK